MIKSVLYCCYCLWHWVFSYLWLLLKSVLYCCNWQ